MALFVNWYIQCFAESNSKSKDLLIGVTAFTRDAIYNLLKRIEKIQKRHGFNELFSIIYVHGPTNDRKFEDDSEMIACPWDKSYSLIRAMKKDVTKRNIYVMGGTVWSWEKIRTKWRTFQGCDMLILDESTQVILEKKKNLYLALSIRYLCLTHYSRLLVLKDPMENSLLQEIIW